MQERTVMSSDEEEIETDKRRSGSAVAPHAQRQRFVRASNVSRCMPQGTNRRHKDRRTLPNGVESGAGSTVGRVRPAAAHLVRFGAEKQDVEWNGGHHVNDEPALEVMHGNFARMRYHFVILIDICCAEVYQNIYDEHDID